MKESKQERLCVYVCACSARGQDASQSTHAIWSEKESWEGPAGKWLCDGWGGHWVVGGGGLVVWLEGCATEEGRLHLLIFSPEFAKSSSFSEAGLFLQGSDTACPSLGDPPAPRSPAGAPSIAP